jgi:hypothetical protein
VSGFLGETANKYLEEIGQLLNDQYFPTEYAQEIKGCANMLDVDYGWVTLLNLGSLKRRKEKEKIFFC